MSLPPPIDPRWVHPEHRDELRSLTLRLPVEGRPGQVFQLGIGGFSSVDPYAPTHIAHDQIHAIEARWDTLVVRDRSGGVHQFELRMTGPEIAELVQALPQVLDRAQRRISPVWRLGPQAEPDPIDPSALIDPRWIPDWAQHSYGDRLHITFPSFVAGPDHPPGNTYLRLRAADIAWPSQGRLWVHSLSDVEGVRQRGEQIEVALNSGEVWSRTALMADRDRTALVEAIRAFIARHVGPEAAPPASLMRLLDTE